MAGKHSEGKREKQTKRIEEEEEIPKHSKKMVIICKKQNQKQRKNMEN